ncbi:MAG: M48 family metallopeptidase [Pontiellaceae bacterium]|nr:M48 family metallopeptidase [Pontiellaceae bacterium]
MVSQIELGDIKVNVIRKKIKNVHLSVYPPTGAVRISAPERMELDTIRVFALSKLAWIKKQQQNQREQERETPREFIERESHYVWGKRYLLKLVEQPSLPSVCLEHNRIVLTVRPGADAAKRREIVEAWYRDRLKEVLPDLIRKWEKIMGVTVEGYTVRKMKTIWGSCTPKTKRIRINTELAKKPPECLEYILVHEMVHLLEATHNRRFVALMDQFMPKWRFHRQQLNQLPVRHEDWKY